MSRSKRTGWLWIAFILLSIAKLPAGEPLFSQDFSNVEAGSVPDDLDVLDGAFAVREKEGNRVLELPGAPLETFGAMFGPAQKENWGAQARFNGTATGRRYPAFSLSINGIAGYRLNLAPAKRAIELLKDEAIVARQPYAWKSGTWTVLRIQIRKTGEDSWKIEGKAWPDGTPEPAEWSISWDETETPLTGRAAVWGFPFSGTPIQFDDLKVFHVGD